MNQLLKIFGVKSHKELMDFIKEHPDDERVVEIREVFELFNLNFEGVRDE
ncbi:MAG TPA: hypothetical protein GX708_22530 [Gallicola sp.]|nr:hypothetical protein [Gallicola sp.]